MIEVLPLGKLQINWQQYLVLAKELLGRSITQGLDNKKLPIDTLAAFVISLGELKTPNSEPVETLRCPGEFLKHVFYNFLIICDDEVLYELMELADVLITSVPVRRGTRLVIASANMSDWRTSVINCCAGYVSYDLRLIFDKILMLFEKEGFASIWYDYQKIHMRDSTFKLTVK